MLKSSSLQNYNTSLSSRLKSPKILLLMERKYLSSLHPNSLNCSIVLKRSFSKWTWFFQERAGGLKNISRILRIISKQARFLQVLDLDNNVNPSDIWFSLLSRCFKRFDGLKEFRLQIRHNCDGNITRTGLGHLCEGLKKLSSLQTLNLDFSGCYSFPKDGLKILIKGFRRHRSLKTLVLYFLGCTKITDSDIENLCKSLKNLVLLRRLDLDFFRCFIITVEGLRMIKKLLKKLKKLQHINIDFRRIVGNAMKWKVLRKDLKDCYKGIPSGF